MKGKILEINTLSAFIAFEDGSHSEIDISYIPSGSSIGSSINLNSIGNVKIVNDTYHSYNKMM